MMTQITGETVKSGIIRQLASIFPCATIFRDAINPALIQYPNFFVTQISAETREIKLGVWRIDYLIEVRYRLQANIEEAVNLNTQLEAVALQIIAGLEYIEVENKKYKLYNTRYEKPDGILLFFANITILAEKPPAPVELQNALDVAVEIKRED